MTISTADHLARLPESVLHAVHRHAEAEERAGRKVLRLHVGEPAFPAPEAARDAIALAMAEGRTDYTSAEGLPELRERLADRLVGSGVDTAPGGVLVTPGSSQALVTIMLAVTHPGDELLLPETHWPIYAQGAAVAGLRTRTYPLDRDYAIDPDAFAASIGPATRIAVVNSPANPTGAVTPPEVLAQLVDRARQRGVWVIGDEAYEDFVYDGRHVPCASVERDVAVNERCVFSVHTFSKAYGMTGYRVGYVAAPNAATATALRRVSEGTIIAPSTPMQYGAMAALDDEDMPRRAHAHVRANRDIALHDVARAGLLRRLPAAGWYAMVDISPTTLTSYEFTEQLLAAEQVAVAPGAAFAHPSAPDPGTVRVAFCGDQAMTVEAMARLQRFVDSHRAVTIPVGTSRGA